jgi:hypothetical protein
MSRSDEHTRRPQAEAVGCCEAHLRIGPELGKIFPQRKGTGLIEYGQASPS